MAHTPLSRSHDALLRTLPLALHADCVLCPFFMQESYRISTVLSSIALSKQQFRCDKCGICRVGGRDNLFHCDTCGACYSVELRNNHVFVANSMQWDCPICYEYLFDSLEAPQVHNLRALPAPQPIRCCRVRPSSCAMPYTVRTSLW